MKYKKYVVYSAVNVIGFWFMVFAQFPGLDRILLKHGIAAAADDLNRHDLGWCVGWLVVTAINSLFQIWYWRKEKREVNLRKPKTRIPTTKVYRQK
jgi:hypothetical protein